MILTLENLKMHARQDGDCLIWHRSIGSHGYPQANIDGNIVIVRNWIFTNLMGRRRTNNFVLTATCGNKLCVNPDHIRQTTRSEVLKRVYSSGLRTPATEYANRVKAAAAAGMIKIGAEEVARMRAEPLEKSHAEIGREYGRCAKQVSLIRRGIRRREAASGSSVWVWRP